MTCWIPVALVVALALLTGCTQKPGTIYTVYISPSMSVQHTQETLDVLGDWELYTNAEFIVQYEEHTVSSGEGYAFSIHEAVSPNAACGEDWNSGYACTVWPNVYGVGVEGNTYLPIADGPHWKHAVEHEIGHDLGLQHSSQLGTLMYPMNEGASPGITCQDVQQFYAVRGDFVPTCSK